MIPISVLAFATAIAAPTDPVVYRVELARAGDTTVHERERRGFRTDELPGLFREATGVETADVWERWLR